MKLANEIFQEIKPETAASVFQYLRDEQREVYKASVSSLASNRKLRPVVIQRKSVTEQVDWLVKNVKLRGSGEIATHTSLLTEFLDGLGIEHDGEGAADDIPDDLDVKKLTSTITALLEKHDPELVSIYLHIFQLQRNEGWEELTKIIDSTPSLQFAVAPVEETTAPATEKSTPTKGEPSVSADEEE